MEFQLPDDVKNEPAAPAIPSPGPGECLFCYLWRMVEIHGCDGLFWAKRYQELCAPRDKSLVRLLEAHGGYCDCEVAMNVVVPHYLAWGRVPDGEVDEEGWAGEEPDKPNCPGVPQGSTMPCGLWIGNGAVGRYAV